MIIQQRIQNKLMQAFQPDALEVINESHQHNVPEGSESHFKVVIVSPLFDGKKLIARHRLINQALSTELSEHIHALALHTLTPAEYAARAGQVADSPRCLGGH